MDQAGLSYSQLWLLYFALGGTATTEQVEAYVNVGAGRPFDDGGIQHDTLVHALNERFMDMDLDHPLPYQRG
jgi:hypothetical protein